MNSFAKRVALLEEWDNKGVKTLEDLAELIANVWNDAEDHAVEKLKKARDKDKPNHDHYGLITYNMAIELIEEDRPTVHYIGDLNE